jgi:pyrophosphatase PpaX
MDLKGFIFDLDGTLLNTIPTCLVAFRKSFQINLGRDYSDREIVALFGPTEEGIFKKLLLDRWQDGLKDYLSEYQRLERGKSPFPGIIEALSLLKEKQLRLAIVSGKGPASMAISLRESGLQPYFETVITGSEHGAEKPVYIRELLKIWKMAPQQVAYVGDTVYDMKAAKEVGLLPIGALWAATAEVEQIKASHPLMSFTDAMAFRKWIEITV